MTPRSRPIELIGVPFNSSGTDDGVGRAPIALRQAGLVEAIGAAARGDVSIPAMTPAREARSGVIAVEAIAPMVASVREAVGTSLGTGRFPIVLGGDCPVLIGCIGAMAERGTPRLLFVDGHEDAWPARQSTTGEAADMELGWLLGRAVDSLPDDLRRAIPTVSADDVILLGARDQAELAESGIESIEDVVRIVRPARILEDPVGTAAWAVSELEARGAWWLHVDLDVLSTDALAAIDYPQPGGLDWVALTRITRRALESPTVQGWTITIYNPDLDPDGVGAERIVRYVAESLAAEPGLPR